MGVIIGFLIGIIFGAGSVIAGLILKKIDEMEENERLEDLKGKNKVKKKEQKNKRD